MLNKDNYIPWSSRLLRYAKSKPNGKLIYNFIMHGPYVRRMITKPGDPDREVPVAETFHDGIDEELTDKEVKQMEADDQAIQTILMGLPEDIYAAVDSYETAEEIWLRVQQIMKGFEIGAQEKKAKLYNVVQNVRNQDVQNAFQNLAAQAKGNGNGNNGNQVRCYNYRGMGHLARNCTVRPWRRDAAYLQTLLLIAQKEEAGIQLQDEEFDLMVAAGDIDEIEEVNANCILMANLQQASTSGTQTDKAPVYDSDGSAAVHHYENCYDNDIFNMFTQEGHYSKLLELIFEPHQVQQNDSNVISAMSSVKQSGGIVEQNLASVEETCALYDSLYNNLSIEFEKIYDKLERCYQKSVYQEQCLTKKINALHLSSAKQITTLNEEIANLNNQLSKENSNVSFLREEKKKLKSDFKIREDELLDKQIQIEQKIKELDNILVKMGQSIQMMHMFSPKLDSFYHTEQKMALGYQNPFYLKQAQQKQQSLYNGKVLLEKHDPLAVYDSEETLQLAQESRLKMKQLNKEIKPTNYTKINHLSRVFVSQTAKSREELYFSNTSKMANVSKSISIPNEEFSDDTTPSVARKFLNEGVRRSESNFGAAAGEAVKKIIATHARIRWVFPDCINFETIYNALNTYDQDSLNSAAGGNFLDKMPRECLKIIESKSKVRNSRSKPVVAKVSASTSTSGISPDVSELKDMVKALLLDKKNQSQAPAQQTPAPVKAVEQSCVTCGGGHSYQNCPATDGNVYRDNIQEYMSQAAAVNYNQGNASYRPQIVANQIRPPGQVYQPQINQPPTFQAPVPPAPGGVSPLKDLKFLLLPRREGKMEPEVTKDTVQPSTENIQPLVVQTNDQIGEPVVASKTKPTLPYPSKGPTKKAREKDNLLSFKIYGDKMIELTKTPVNENCSAVILKKLPEKLGDPGRFLIPCDFPEMDECLALADLGASINLMPPLYLERTKSPSFDQNPNDT
ncbi:hypothetical protein Tco_0580464 [Tanacetum coccineum]